MSKWVTIILAILGVGVAVYTAATISREKPAAPPPAAPPSVNPYSRGIAGTGIVEAASRNLAVGLPEPGLVVEVVVQVGDTVQKDQPLLRLDGRLLEAELIRARAALGIARARLAQAEAMPRAESLPPLEAAVTRAKSKLADEEARLADVQRADQLGSATPSEIDRRRWAVAMAKAELSQAENELALVRAGAWEKEIAVLASEVAAAQAEVASIQLRLERLTVRSPIAGSVLKRNVEPGQFAAIGTGAVAAIVVGDLSRLHIRARIDEEDAPQLRAGARGTARVRGVKGEDLPLSMIRIEPYALPKTDLSGLSTERVDTRVVEVVFELASPGGPRIYPGQLVDVFVDVGAEAAGQGAGAALGQSAPKTSPQPVAPAGR